MTVALIMVFAAAVVLLLLPTADYAARMAGRVEAALYVLRQNPSEDQLCDWLEEHGKRGPFIYRTLWRWLEKNP